MEDSTTVSAIRRFLMLIQEGSPPSDEELARTLDELAMLYHETPEGMQADDARDPPSADYSQRHAQLAKRFPTYDFYAVSDPTEPVNEEGMCGDAIDDLADITLDLEQVVWRSENVGSDDAHWHFKMLYRIHWGGIFESFPTTST